MTNEGKSGQTKGTEFTRPFSLWESKMEKIIGALPCHGRTELNS